MTAVVERPSDPHPISGYKSVAHWVKQRANTSPDAVAMRHKNLGIWEEISWAGFWDEVVVAANALLALGITPGDRVSIHSEDRPEWVVMDMAAVAVRGVTVGLYPTNPAAEVVYTLNDCGARVHLAEDEEQADKVINAPADTFPTVEKIIYIEERGIRRSSDPRLIEWNDFLALGREFRQSNPNAVDATMADAQGDDLMTLVYTSGTTGPPKGAMLTNANASFAMDMIATNPQRMADGKPAGLDDQVLTYLPLCHVAERTFSTWTMCATGVVLNFAESIDTVNENLREVQPTIFFAVPRIWEKLHATILIKGSDAKGIKQLLFRQSMRAARRIGAARVANDGNWTLASRIEHRFWWLLVYRALLERIGLRRCRWASSAAAPIAPEILEFFMGLGLNVFELYGMTENSAVATCNFAGRVKNGTVGEPYPSIKDGFRIDEETGEIQVRHAGVFAGYWGKPEKSAEALTDDGWLRTGDVGEWVDGTHVKIVDRIKHIIITAGGKNISPSEIENSLKTSPYIKEAMVIGDRRKYLSALIGIELDTVGNWALRQAIPYTTYRDLSEKPEVVELIDQEVNKTNEKFASVESIKKFRLLPKELDHEDGELTATQKVKRSSLEEAFSDLVEDMYS